MSNTLNLWTNEGLRINSYAYCYKYNTHLTKIHHFYAIDNVALNRIPDVFLVLFFLYIIYVVIYRIFS